MSLEGALCIRISVTTADLHDGDFIVSLVVLGIDSNSPIEPDKEILRTSCFKLDNYRMTGRVVQIIRDSDECHIGVLRSRDSRVNQKSVGTVPSTLPALGWIEAHLSDIIRVERISHHASMIRVCLSI